MRTSYACTISSAGSKTQRRRRGEIAKLPSGSLRVKVHGGIDPLSGRRHYLTETIPAGPTAHADAEKARTRLLNQVDEQRNPRTRATVDQLMDRTWSCSTSSRRPASALLNASVAPTT
ncbi:MAG: hypothetical protein ACRDSL_02920 [Pseudonocardiaceae bacterium]